MGFSSQSGAVSFRTQSVPGTFPADFATAGTSMKLKTGALAANRDLLIPDPEIGGGRDIADAFLGPVTFSGDYEFYVRLNAIMTLLNGAMGTHIQGPGFTAQEVETITATGTVSGGTFTLTYAAQTTAAIPWNATAQQVQDALIALSNIGPYEVLVTGGPWPTTPFVVTFDGTLTGTLAGAPMTGTFTGLTGTTPGGTITRTSTGVSSTNTFSHLFVPSDAAQLPFIGIEENIGNGFDVYRYTDAVVNTLHWECDANGYFMGTAGMIAKSQQAQASAVDMSSKLDNLDMIVGTNVTVAFGGVSLAAKSMKFDFTNNFESDDFRLGSFFIGDLTPKRRECTVGVNIREQDKNLWRQATYGSSAATVPGGTMVKNNVTITASTYAVIPGSAPSLVYKLETILPWCAIKPYALSVSGDDIIDSDIELQALRPYASNPLVKVRVTNGNSSAPA
jgi:hypothetical protein